MGTLDDRQEISIDHWASDTQYELDCNMREIRVNLELGELLYTLQKIGYIVFRLSENGDKTSTELVKSLL